jgi:hypothetical protein
MKRILLASLLSFLVVGQTFTTDYNRREAKSHPVFSGLKGAFRSAVFPAIFAGIGGMFGGKKWAAIGANIGTVPGHFYWLPAALFGETNSDRNSIAGYVTATALIHFGTIVALANN